MFTEVFVKILQKKNITPYQVAKDTGISQGLMGEYKKGIKIPSVTNLLKLADYLDCSVDYLLGRTENIDSTYSINNQNSTINGTQANVINNSTEHQDDMTEEFIKTFEKLEFADKVAVMNFAISKLDK